MQKYFVKKCVNNVVSFLNEDEHHILKVMRMHEGDQIIAFHNNRKYLTKIVNINPLRAEIINEIIDDTNNHFSLNVFMANIKPNKMEIAIQKACELNVDNFYIFNAHYSQHNQFHNLERYEKIIKEASEQSNRSKLMSIKLIDANELVTLGNNLTFNLIADFSKNKTISMPKIEHNKELSIGIIIGPEGGFSHQDYQIFEKINYQRINLTKTILRSETALIYLLSVVSYILLSDCQ